MYGILQSQENCRNHNGRKKSMEKEITKKIRVYGIVQGVGFRPTVSRHADSCKIREVSVIVDLMLKSSHRKRDGSESVY